VSLMRRYIIRVFSIINNRNMLPAGRGLAGAVTWSLQGWKEGARVRAT